MLSGQRHSVFAEISFQKHSEAISKYFFMSLFQVVLFFCFISSCLLKSFGKRSVNLNNAAALHICGINV